MKSLLRAIALILGLPFVAVGLPLIAFAIGVRINWSDSFSDVCRKLA